LIILVYRPDIIDADLPTDDSAKGIDPSASIEISASSAKSILDIAVFADLVSAYLSG
jgi:hypothetical protein